MYATLRFHLVNLFSLRAVTTNAFTARTLLCPTPASLKLSLLAHLIERDAAGRTPDEIASLAQQHLDWLAPLRVAWSPPALLAVSAVTISVLKDDNGKTPLIRSVGMREYAHFDQPFSLTFGPVSDSARQADLADALRRLRRLGVAESLVQPLAPPQWTDVPPQGFVWLTEPTDQRALAPTGEPCVLDDLGRAPRFERLSVYRPNEADYVPRLGEDRLRHIVVLPLRQRRQSLDTRVLTRTTDDGVHLSDNQTINES